METLYAIIFIQGLIWAALLLRKSRPAEVWLGLSFAALGAFYFMEYAEDVYSFGVPLYLKFSSILLLLLLTAYHQFKSLVLYKVKNWKVFPGTIILFLILVLIQVLVFPEDRKGTWLFAGIAGILSIITDSSFLYRRILAKTHTGSILDASNYRLHFHILAFKVLFTAIILMNLISLEQSRNNPSVSEFLILGVIALLVFLSGYQAVQYSYAGKPVLKKREKIEPVNDMNKRVIQLMKEQKPYLDCELTLGKVAAMLDISEYELSRVLHSEMQTSFYDLINEYRIAAVKEKLLQPDSKKYTIMSAAYESGFNSSSTFYRIFKEHTGMQPKEFIELKA